MLKLVLNKSFPVVSRWHYDYNRKLAFRCLQDMTHTKHVKLVQIGHCMLKLVLNKSLPVASRWRYIYN